VLFFSRKFFINFINANHTFFVIASVLFLLTDAARMISRVVLLGILEREQENAVQYGSVDFGKTNQWDEDFSKRLGSVARWFHLASHKIVNNDEKVLDLSTSVELKVSRIIDCLKERIV
jgi:hypothetical protein